MAIAVLRPAVPADIPALGELEQVSFAVPNWPADTFLHYDCTVAEVAGKIAGFLVSRQLFSGGTGVLPEREILNVAVAPEFRRMGIATQLFQHEFQQKAHFWLEVRESNQSARQLYERLGFVEISRRHNYYDHPLETAIVMQVK